MRKHKAIIPIFLLPLGIFVATKNAEAHTITIPSSAFFHLWQQNTYINFASTTSLDNVTQTNDKLYLNQCWFSVENANLTISKLFASYQLIFIVDAPLGTTSTTNIYVDDWGEPTSVYANGTLTSSFDPADNIATFMVNHSSPVEITVDWGILGDIDRDGDVDFDDFTVLAGAYGSIHGDPAYDERADFDRDDDVDYDDFIILAGNYGKTINSKSLTPQSISSIVLSITLIAYMGITSIRLGCFNQMRKRINLAYPSHLSSSHDSYFVSWLNKIYNVIQNQRFAFINCQIGRSRNLDEYIQNF